MKRHLHKQKRFLHSVKSVWQVGTPTGIRTPVAAVKGQCPRPLDDGRVTESRTITKAPVIVNVAAGGIERQQSGAVRFESVWFMVRQSLLRAAQ